MQSFRAEVQQVEETVQMCHSQGRIGELRVVLGVLGRPGWSYEAVGRVAKARRAASDRLLAGMT